MDVLLVDDLAHVALEVVLVYLYSVLVVGPDLGVTALKL